MSSTDSVGSLQITDGDSIESTYFDEDPKEKQTATALADEDPEPLSLGPVAEFSVGKLGGITLSHSESVIEIPFSEDVSKAGGESGALTLGDNVTVTVDGDDVTSRYVLDADGSSGGQVILSAATPLDPRAELSVRIDAVNDSVDTETIRPGVVDVAVTDATVTEGSDADVFENETLAFVANDGTEDVDQSFEVEDGSGAFVFAGRTGAGSQAFVFDTAARNWSGEYGIATRLGDGSIDERTSLAVRTLKLDVAIDDRTVTTDDPIEGTVSANTAGRETEIALVADDETTVARVNETTGGNGESRFAFGSGAVAAAGPGNYTVTATDVATRAGAISERIRVVDAALQTAAFRTTVVGDDAGDVPEITVDLTYADAATATIGGADSGFRANVTVADRDGDGEVRVRFNTDAVAGKTSLPADGGDVFEIAPSSENATANESDEIIAADVDDRYAVDAPLAAGEYALGVRPGTDPSAPAESVGTLILDAPAPESFATWVAPAAVEFGDFGDVERAIDASRLTRTTEIAVGDLVVHRIVAPGIAGALASQSGTTAEAFFALAGTDSGDRYALNVTRADPPSNADAYRLAINGSNADVVADPSNDTYVVAYRIEGPGGTDDGDAVGTHDAGGTPGAGDALSAAFVVNGSGVFDGLDGAERTLSDEYALVEGRIGTDGDPVAVAAAPNQSIAGWTTAAPGTVVDLRVRSANGSDAFLKTGTAVVGADGGWLTVFDFGNRTVGENFTLTSRVGVVGDGAELAVDGAVRAVVVSETPNATGAAGASGAGGGGGDGGSGATGAFDPAGDDDAVRIDATATSTPPPTATSTGDGESILDSIRGFGQEVVATVTNDRGEDLPGRLTSFDVVLAFSGLLVVCGFFATRLV